MTMKFTLVMWGNKAARIIGSISPSKLFERNGFHLIVVKCLI